MKANTLKTSLFKSGLAASIFLLASGIALADSTVILTAAPTTTTLPDGQTVPMWGYSCGTALDGGVVTPRVSCNAANGSPPTSGWQPPLITVQIGRAHV